MSEMKFQLKKETELTFLEKRELKALVKKANDLLVEISYFERAGDRDRVEELKKEHEELVETIKEKSGT